MCLKLSIMAARCNMPWRHDTILESLVIGHQVCIIHACIGCAVNLVNSAPQHRRCCVCHLTPLLRLPPAHQLLPLSTASASAAPLSTLSLSARAASLLPRRPASAPGRPAARDSSLLRWSAGSAATSRPAHESAWPAWTMLWRSEACRAASSALSLAWALVVGVLAPAALSKDVES